MLLDGHIHIFSDQPPDPAGLRRRLQSAGISGGVILSLSPHWFRKLGARRRLDNLLAWTQTSPNLFPFYWIARDRTIYRRLKLSTGTQSGIFAENLKRFLGISRQPIRLAPPRCAE